MCAGALSLLHFQEASNISNFTIAPSCLKCFVSSLTQPLHPGLLSFALPAAAHASAAHLSLLLIASAEEQLKVQQQ